MKDPLARERFTAHDQRNSLVVRIGLLTLISLFLLYLLATTMGWIPDRFIPGKRNTVQGVYGVESHVLRSNYTTVDPEPYLGKAIAGTRFRFIHSKCVALVTQPDLHALQYAPTTRWEIPDVLHLDGTVYTVTALEPTAFLYADGMNIISLPKTLKYLNNAHTYMRDELQFIELRRTDDEPLVLTKEAFIEQAEELFPLPHEESTTL